MYYNLPKNVLLCKLLFMNEKILMIFYIETSLWKKDFGTIWQDRKARQNIYRAIVRGGAGGALAPPEFGSSVNLSQAEWADYANHLLIAPPDLKKTNDISEF